MAPSIVGLPGAVSGVAAAAVEIPLRAKCVYLLLQDSEVVYVGASGSIYSRIAGHTRVTPGYPKEFSRAVVILCDGFDNLAIERVLIELLKPKYNLKVDPVTASDESEFARFLSSQNTEAERTGESLP